MTITESFKDSDYPPVKPSTPIQIKGQVIYLKDYIVKRRVKAVRLAAVGGKG
jgi:hypothetical protein